MTTTNTTYTRSQKTGFTLIELLVVIAIIAILASVIFGSMSTMRERGKAAKIINDVRSMRDAIQFRYSEATEYPTEEALRTAYGDLPVGNISIQDMIDEDVFNGKFDAAPTPGIGTNIYYYDADTADGSTTYPIDSCGSYTNNEYGVNIMVVDAISTDPNVVTQLDELVDAGDGLDCGKVRRTSGVSNVLLYNISVIPSIFP